MEILLRRFPNSNLPKDSMDDFEAELAKVEREFGTERMLATVERIKEWEIDDFGNERRRKFFPNPNELWGFVPPPKNNDLPRGCGVCQWQPWVMVEKFGKRVATRCACWDDPSLRTPQPFRSEAWVDREQATPEYQAAQKKFRRTFMEHRDGLDMGSEFRKRAVARDEQYDKNRNLVDQVRREAK